MLAKIRQTILEHALIQRGDSVLVALSGGADSVALLRGLLSLSEEMGFSVSAAHLNHGIRGEAASADEAFCRSLCASLGVTVGFGRADVPGRASRTGESLEQAAREERYAFLERARLERGANLIAVAHHMEDQAESVLLHLGRGSGLAGLVGMRPRRDAIIRPMLYVRRRQIEEYLLSLGQDFRTDETNFSQSYSRNRIRMELIPYLEETVNPEIVEGLCSAAELLYRDEECLLGLSRDSLLMAKRGAGYDRYSLMNLPMAVKSRALRLAMAEAGAKTDVTRTNVEAAARLLESGTGASLNLPHGISMWVSYDIVRFGAFPEQQSGYCRGLVLPGRTPVPGGAMIATILEGGDYERGPRVGYLDLDKVTGMLLVRPRRHGDRFYPVGAPGSRKLKQFLIDRKVPREERGMPIVFMGDEAVFVPGFCVSERVKVDPSTSRMARVEYVEDS